MGLKDIDYINKKFIFDKNNVSFIVVIKNQGSQFNSIHDLARNFILRSISEDERINYLKDKFQAGREYSTYNGKEDYAVAHYNIDLGNNYTLSNSIRFHIKNNKGYIVQSIKTYKTIDGFYYPSNDDNELDYKVFRSFEIL